MKFTLSFFSLMFSESDRFELASGGSHFRGHSRHVPGPGRYNICSGAGRRLRFSKPGRPGSIPRRDMFTKGRSDVDDVRRAINELYVKIYSMETSLELGRYQPAPRRAVQIPVSKGEEYLNCTFSMFAFQFFCNSSHFLA